MRTTILVLGILIHNAFAIQVFDSAMKLFLLICFISFLWMDIVELNKNKNLMK